MTYRTFLQAVVCLAWGAIAFWIGEQMWATEVGRVFLQVAGFCLGFAVLVVATFEAFDGDR